MKAWFVCGVAIATLSPLFGLRAATAAPLVDPHEAALGVVIADLDVIDGAVTALLSNTSPRLVRDIQLLIRHTWMWNDERHPGEDSPGRAEFLTLREGIPAGGSIPFKYAPNPPLPPRSDGHFTTTVEVVGFTEVGG